MALVFYESEMAWGWKGQEGPIGKAPELRQRVSGEKKERSLFAEARHPSRTRKRRAANRLLL